MAWHKRVTDAIASCKKNYEDKLNAAKCELAKQEKAHPLYVQVENQGNLLGKLTGFYNRYKSELKKVVDPEEFQRIRDDVEGSYDLFKQIQNLKWDLGLLVQELKKANPRNSPLGPEHPV